MDSRKLFTLSILACTFVKVASAACIASGTEADINAALNGTGAQAVLCQGATFQLNNPVVFTAANQQIFTDGLPTDSRRAILRITSSNANGQAIGGNQSGITIENIEVDGQRPALGVLKNGSALIEIGGNVSNQTVKNIYAHDGRGWSILHIQEGTVTNNVPTCQGATITNNSIGPSGTSDGNWADGISLACGSSTVTNNQVTDATDGGIVIFGAPGSLIQNNTITAASRVLLGGINMVDWNPVGGNYSGTRVIGNTINAKGALIKVGIAQGPATWFCDTQDRNSGGSVTQNTLIGANFGYGYAVNGVSNWTVTNNIDQARHIGVTSTGCGQASVDRPAGFQYQTIASTTLQSEFVPATIYWLLGISEPSILTAVQPSTACGTFTANQGILPNQSLLSCDGRFALTLQSSGNLVLTQGTSQLFATNTAGLQVAEAILQGDGNFVLYNVTGQSVWSTNTAGNAGARLLLQGDGNLVIYNGSTAIWSSGTCCH
jgi:parallel beta-helix repeat protein